MKNVKKYFMFKYTLVELVREMINKKMEMNKSNSQLLSSRDEV